MNFINYNKDIFTKIVRRLKESDIENIIWWINLTPSFVGFSISTHRNSVVFWITHFALLSYLSFLSNFVYRLKLADDVDGIIQANTNLLLVIFTMNISLWFLTKRSLVMSTIEKVKYIDKLTLETKFLNVKHKKWIKKLKIIVLIYYIVNFFNTCLVWMPQRMDLSSAFYTAYPCPGINVTSVISKYLCRWIIFVQYVTISIVDITFPSLLMFLIAHTAIMFNLLSEEMEALNQSKDTDIACIEKKKQLSLLIKRHVLLLDMVKRLRSLYSIPIGVNFGANVFCMCLFLSLSLEALYSVAPLLGYCFLVSFMYCYLCQKLIDSSIAFEHSVYACGWENYSLSDMKTIYILLKQAQEPVLVLAANIIPVNMLTFATGMQFIYKFITALKV